MQKVNSKKVMQYSSSSDSEVSIEIRDEVRELKIEHIRRKLENTLPWNWENIIPRYSDLFSSSETSVASQQPMNDFHGYLTDVESNTSSENLANPLHPEVNPNQEGPSTSNIPDPEAEVEPQITEPNFGEINVKSILLNISEFQQNNKIAVNYITQIWCGSTILSSEQFVIILEKSTNNIILHGKGNIQAT